MNSPVDEVLGRLKNVRRGGGGWAASCPVPGHGKGRGDRKSSLSVNADREGTVAIKCHVGCLTDEVVEALGLSMRDLFARSDKSANVHHSTVETYDYTDEHGNLLFQSVRLEPKRFFQRKPDGAEGWITKGIFENGTRPVLYRLPSVLKAVREGRPVWVVEGEKDVHRLEDEGLTTTTNPMGAGKWRAHFSKALEGADVRIIPDNDSAGLDHAREVEESLRGWAREVRVVELPGLGVGGDVSDWLAAGGTAEQLQALPSSPSSSYRGGDGDDGGLEPVEGLKLTSFASVPRPPDERSMVIEGMIPQGFPAMLYGDGGTAKSLLAASLLLDVSRGAGSWMRHEIKRHGPAIYLDFELDLQEQARRVYQLAEGVGLNGPPEDLHYVSGANHPPGEVLDRTLELGKETGAVLVLLDSLGFALEGDMEASRDVLRFIREHVLPFKDANVTLLIVDHQSRQRSGEGYHQKSPFGSVYKSNACRSVIQVGVEDQSEDELVVRFRHKKANFGSKFDPFDAQLLFHGTKLEIRHRALDADAVAAEGSLNISQKIRRLLRDGPMFPHELVAKIDASEGAVKNKITDLRRDNKVVRTGEVSATGAQQVRLAQTQPSWSSPNGAVDDDDGRRDSLHPGAVPRASAGTPTPEGDREGA